MLKFAAKKKITTVTRFRKTVRLDGGRALFQAQSPQNPQPTDSTSHQGSSGSSSKRAQPDKVSQQTHHADQTMPAQP
jgi:hypothetical protein